MMPKSASGSQKKYLNANDDSRSEGTFMERKIEQTIKIEKMEVTWKIKTIDC
jgi:hypothetical protein